MTWPGTAAAPDEPFSVDVVVDDPAGPRAAVSYPPFADALPLADFEVVQVRGAGRQAVRLELDCRNRPDAVALLTPDDPETQFHVSTFVRSHPSGNGYIVVRVERRPGTAEQRPQSLETVLDPVRHRSAVTALCELGSALIITRAQPRQAAIGVSCTVDRDQLDKAYDAALRNPRRVRYVARRPEPSG